MDFVFTLCDGAARETCPVWVGQPITAHWGIEDPAAVEGADIQKQAAFVLAALEAIGECLEKLPVLCGKAVGKLCNLHLALR